MRIIIAIWTIWTQNNQHYTTHGNTPKGSGPYIRAKSHIQHTHSQHLSTSIQATTHDKTLTETGCGKQKETPIATYKAVMRPALKYASSIFSPLASSTSIKKLHVMQIVALRTAQDAHKTHSCMTKHSFFLYTSTYSSTRHKTHHPSHPLHKHTIYFNTLRLNTIFNKDRYTTNIPTDPHSHSNRHKTTCAMYIDVLSLGSSHKGQYQNTAHTSTTH